MTERGRDTGRAGAGGTAGSGEPGDPGSSDGTGRSDGADGEGAAVQRPVRRKGTGTATGRPTAGGPANRPRYGLRIAVPALLLTVLLAFPGLLPNTPGHLGSLAETALPWFGAAVLPLLGWAAVRRSPAGVAAALIPAVTWSCLFLPGLFPAPDTGRADFHALTLNVGGDRTSPEAVARKVIATGADVVALEKVPPSAMRAYERALGATYRHHAVHNTLGLWSRYPLHGVDALHLGGAWPHAIRAVARTPGGDTAFYAVRLPSVRLRADQGFAVKARNASAAALADHVSRDPAARLVLLGDLNGSLRDRDLAPLARHLTSAQEEAGRGFGFTWPAPFPLVRIDHVLLRGLTATTTTVLPDLGSDHRPVLTGLSGAGGRTG
ncbi:endonuclease/exonuclease/phosphatase family protein [Streptomyces celluloflavus]|uniref:Endonuclease/exonuclease/phosphatase family protein n=1 Tax=Streptomyces celluloflavus TaxID=58344 RepID=A0ABW7RFX5_9ACTN